MKQHTKAISSRIEMMEKRQDGKPTGSRNQEMLVPGTSKKQFEKNNRKPSSKSPRRKASAQELSDMKQELIELESVMNIMLYNEPLLLEQIQICYAQIVDLTSQIPIEDTNGDLFNEWSDKVADLSTKLGKVTSSGKLLEPPMKLTKESVRNKLEIAFALLTSGTSLVELRALTTLAAKAQAILKHFPSDPQLNSDLVDFAMAKFTDRMAHKFTKHNQYRKANLNELLTFLCIKMDKRRQHELKKTPSKKDLLQAASSSFSYCFYCHGRGHTIQECDRLYMQVCFNCFKNGHQLTECPNPEPSLEELVHSISRKF